MLPRLEYTCRRAIKAPTSGLDPSEIAVVHGISDPPIPSITKQGENRVYANTYVPVVARIVDCVREVLGVLPHSRKNNLFVVLEASPRVLETLGVLPHGREHHLARATLGCPHAGAGRRRLHSKVLQVIKEYAITYSTPLNGAASYNSP